MAPESTTLTTQKETGSPYRLDSSQTLRASGALLKHIRNTNQQKDADSTTKNLLASDPTSTDTSTSDVEPIWLIFTSKKFMTDQRHLKPRKVFLPHSLNTSSALSICLITPEPQRSFKDAIAHTAFPTSLSQRITKIISVQKLEKKYHSFESKRQLRDSYDIFLADDRIITYLSKILGKTFYKTTPKRPIPVHLEAPKTKERKNAALPSTKPRKEPSDSRSIAPSPHLVKEIERTLSTAQIHISPSTTTAVKVGFVTFTAEQIVANIEAVVTSLTDKLVAWRNVKAIHIKGPNTMALPVWLTKELWADEGMILENHEVEEAKIKEAQKGKKKRKAIEAPLTATAEELVAGTKRKGTGSVDVDGELRSKKAKRTAEEDLSREMKERREKLRQQKREAREKIEEGIAGGANNKVPTGGERETKSIAQST